jgi:subtilisin family serine protease
MYSVQYGGKHGPVVTLREDPSLVVVRTRSRRLLSATDEGGLELSSRTRKALGVLESKVRFASAGVEVLQVRGRKASPRLVLKKDPAIHFAGRVLVSPRGKDPVIYTENFFVKFVPELSPSQCKAVLGEFGLSIKRALDYAANAYFVGAPENTGRKVFAIAARLLKRSEVQLCHPELVRRRRTRQAFPDQWHLKRTTVDGTVIDAHAGIEAAWGITEGQGITIAVIDDGVDIDHEEFASAGKIVAPRDVTRRSGDPRPGSRDDHGTACAGVACADGQHGASGVAPRARLMPIRLASGLGSQQEADAFYWAAQNGADVISCSWGPPDGDPTDPTDPFHQDVYRLNDSTRLAIDYAVNNGRAGKGCVITWAAGNGNESVDNDGLASYEKVIAVAACNGRGTRSYYSDYGRAIWCAFPSNDHRTPQTPGIWTVDRTGADGYNPGQATLGDAAGNYTNSFGGTSSAAPGAAGVAALILGRAPTLRWDEVRDLMKRCCDRIDQAGGRYDATGRSRYYGYGRLNARTAMNLIPQGNAPLAAPAGVAAGGASVYRAIHTAVQDVPVQDLQASTLSLVVGETQAVRAIEVTVDIEHTYIGDLIVRLLPPSPGGNPTPVILHNRTGGSDDNLKRSYGPANTPGLGVLIGTSPAGTWTLEVADREAQDTGKINRFGLDLTF